MDDIKVVELFNTSIYGDNNLCNDDILIVKWSDKKISTQSLQEIRNLGIIDSLPKGNAVLLENQMGIIWSPLSVFQQNNQRVSTVNPAANPLIDVANSQLRVRLYNDGQDQDISMQEIAAKAGNIGVTCGWSKDTFVINQLLYYLGV
jgi:hypothetical protein